MSRKKYSELLDQPPKDTGLNAGWTGLKFKGRWCAVAWDNDSGMCGGLRWAFPPPVEKLPARRPGSWEWKPVPSAWEPALWTTWLVSGGERPLPCTCGTCGGKPRGVSR